MTLLAMDFSACPYVPEAQTSGLRAIAARPPDADAADGSPDVLLLTLLTLEARGALSAAMLPPDCPELAESISFRLLPSLSTSLATAAAAPAEDVCWGWR